MTSRHHAASLDSLQALTALTRLTALGISHWPVRTVSDEPPNDPYGLLAGGIFSGGRRAHATLPPASTTAVLKEELDWGLLCHFIYNKVRLGHKGSSLLDIGMAVFYVMVVECSASEVLLCFCICTCHDLSAAVMCWTHGLLCSAHSLQACIGWHG